MSKDDNSTESGALLPGAERPSLEHCRNALEAIIKLRSPIVLYNWKFGHDGLEEAKTLARVLMEDKSSVFIMRMDEGYLEDLYISLPFDEVQAFEAGRAVVVSSIGREDRPLNSPNRPVDTPLIHEAKVALQVTAFRLRAMQKVVELWRAAAGRNPVSPRRATEKATKTLLGLDPSDIEVLDTHPLLRWFNGLIDRARRLAADFFQVAAPRQAERHFAERTAERLTKGDDPDLVEADHIAQLRTFEMHEERAVVREGAMQRWSRDVEDERPIGASDMREIANAHRERQSARELMRVAIDGSLNPADVQGHSQLMVRAFKAGRKVGLVLRGHPVMLTVADATQIRKAITVARHQILETDEDAAYFYLADALARFPDPFEWLRIADNILASKTPEMVRLGNNLT